jgi:hypothetical protein
MTATPCPSAEDTAAYALGALRDGEWEHIARHAETCAICRDEIAEHQFAVDALAVAVPQHQAPPALKGRIMSVVEAEAELLQAAGASADRPVRQRRSLLSLRPMPAFALASVLLAVGLGTGALLENGSGPASRSISAQVDPTAAPGATAVLRVHGDSARLVVAHLPAPPAGRIYQVWLDRANDRQPPQPTTALFSVDRHGSASVDVPGNLRHYSAVLVTAEPLGGSTVPSESPVVQAKLS